MIIIGFLLPHFSERGTNVSTFLYAHYNETILKNKSIIIYLKNHFASKNYVQQRFENRFLCLSVNHLNDLELDSLVTNNQINCIYQIISGKPEWQSKIVPNLIHSVFFDTKKSYGERFACVSHVFKNSGLIVPHIVLDLHQTLNITNQLDYEILLNEQKKEKITLREKLGIPNDGIVVGRIGGIPNIAVMVHPWIYYSVIKCSNLYYIFVNTSPIINPENGTAINHEHIFYLPGFSSVESKKKFIDACDILLHTSLQGETFGLVISEFAIENKIILTHSESKTKYFDPCFPGFPLVYYGAHLDFLGTSGHNNRYFLFDIEDANSFFRSLVLAMDLLFRKSGTGTIRQKYKYFSPKNVMNQFYNVFLRNLNFKLSVEQTEIVINSHSYVYNYFNENQEKFQEIKEYLENSIFSNQPSGEIIMIDIGSCFGKKIFLYHQLSNFKYIVSFEKNNEKYEILKRNIFENGLENKVRTYPLNISYYSSFDLKSFIDYIYKKTNKIESSIKEPNLTELKNAQFKNLPILINQNNAMLEHLLLKYSDIDYTTTLDVYYDLFMKNQKSFDVCFISIGSKNYLDILKGSLLFIQQLTCNLKILIWQKVNVHDDLPFLENLFLSYSKKVKCTELLFDLTLLEIS